MFVVASHPALPFGSWTDIPLRCAQMARPGPSSSRHTPSALDDLALLADGYHASLLFDREQAVAALDLASTESITQSTTGLVVKLAARTDPSPNGTSTSASAKNKGKGRALEESASDDGLEPDAKRLKAAYRMSVNGGAGSVDTVMGNASSPALAETASGSQSPSIGRLAPIPPFRPDAPHLSSGTLPSRTIIPQAEVPVVVTAKGLAALLPATSTSPVELSVHSKDDLKALMHVRKMINKIGNEAMDPEKKRAMLGFLEGGTVVVRSLPSILLLFCP